jgi:DNA-binding XRE family transcriptional regulator
MWCMLSKLFLKLCHHITTQHSNIYVENCWTNGTWHSCQGHPHGKNSYFPIISQWKQGELGEKMWWMGSKLFLKLCHHITTQHSNIYVENCWTSGTWHSCQGHPHGQNSYFSIISQCKQFESGEKMWWMESKLFLKLCHHVTTQHSNIYIENCWTSGTWHSCQGHPHGQNSYFPSFLSVKDTFIKKGKFCDI